MPTATATDPLPDSSSTMDSRLIFQDRHFVLWKHYIFLPPKVISRHKKFSKLGLSIGYLTSSLQSIWFRVPQEGTYKLRDGHRDLLTEMVDSVKILEHNVFWIMSFRPSPVSSSRHYQTFLNAHFQLSPRPIDGVAYQTTFEIV